jgi:hypothetical protein
MSRLRVGDIEIDGSSVRIGGAVPGAPPAAQKGVAQASNAGLLLWLRRVPVRSRVLVGSGAVAASAGTAVNVLFSVWTDPAAALLHGGFLAPLGAGVAALGLMRAYATRKPEAVMAAALGGDPEPYLRKLRPILASGEGRATVQWLVSRTGWSEREVEHALGLLRHRGEISEELDYDTGQFHYVAQLPPPRDLTSRLGNPSRP